MSKQQHSLDSSKKLADPDFAAYIGIDWSDRKHDICLYEVETQSQQLLKLSIKPRSFMIGCLGFDNATEVAQSPLDLNKSEDP
jgi:hypothetical protein